MHHLGVVILHISTSNLWKNWNASKVLNKAWRFSLLNNKYMGSKCVQKRVKVQIIKQIGLEIIIDEPTNQISNSCEKHQWDLQ